jgi:hypothetical protein
MRPSLAFTPATVFVTPSRKRPEGPKNPGDVTVTPVAKRAPAAAAARSSAATSAGVAREA